MTTSTRKTDAKCEKILHQFLEQNFYARLSSAIFGSMTKDIESVTDKARQCLGVDTVIHLDKEDLFVDEKAALRYANRDLKSFAFEILYKQSNGLISDGWFVNEKVKTTHYLVMWLRVRGKKSRDGNWINGEEYLRLFTYKDLVAVEAYLIDRAHMYTYLKTRGIVLDDIKKKALEMHNGNLFKVPLLSDGIRLQNSGFRQEASSKVLYEEPVNLIVSKSILCDLASHRFLIKPNELALS